MRKTIIAIIMFLLVLNIAYAISNPRPIITVTTNEPSEIVTYSLTDLSGDDIDVEQITTSSGIEFKFQPKENLIEGNYTFSITLKDQFENTNQKTYEFTIEIAPLTIKIIEPKYGHTSKKLFDLKIDTNRKAYCKFDNYDFDFKNMQNFNETGNTDHILYGYNLDTNHKYKLYVKCNDSYKHNIVSKNFVLHFDDSYPTITEKKAEPSTAVEYPPKTKLIVKTNEDSVCKYSLDKTLFEEMQNWFEDITDPQNIGEGNFSTEHEVNITLPTDPSQADYTYHIKCKNKANLTSTADDTIAVKVDLSAELNIYVNTPAYSSSTSVDLDINTNKQSQCLYGTEQDNYTSSLSTTDNKRHKATLSLSSGSYTYYVMCRAYPEEATATISFVIDTTPPKMISVEEIGYGNESGKTYKTSSLEGKWEAEDNESGVIQYNVLLYRDNDFTADELIDSLLTSDTEEEFNGLDLNDSETYYFKVSAKNNVGLWSENKTGEGITVDTSGAPASCNNGNKDSNEAGVDCGGVCSKGCKDGTSCDKDSDCLSGWCNSDTDKCDAPTCDDGFENGKESDIDCGGNCTEKCDIGEGCSDDDDCASGNCDVSSGECVEKGKCYNNKLDPGESDTDCGGVCLVKCENSDKCDTNYDCESNYCIDNICAASTSNKCYNDEQDQDETDIDCGGSCSPCSNGNTCLSDYDCISGNCESGVCSEIIDDKDNDGLSNEWEDEYNEGDLDPGIYDSDGDGTSDGEEDFDEDGLDNLAEQRYGTDPHKKDTDGDGYSDGAEVEKGTSPLDPDDYPKSSALLWIFLLILLILLGVGGYFGYKKYKETKQGKIEIPPIEEEKEGNMPELSSFETKPEKPKPAPARRTLPPGILPGFAKKKEQKTKKRERLFDKFGAGNLLGKEEIKIKEEPKTKTFEEEGPRVGWVEVEAPKKEKTEERKEKMSSIFDELPKIKVSKARGKLPGEDVFAALSMLIGSEVKEKTVKEFKDVAERKKLSKDQLIKLINKLSKEEKLDEDNLHKILVSMLEKKKAPVKTKKTTKKTTKKKKTKKKK